MVDFTMASEGSLSILRRSHILKTQPPFLAALAKMILGMSMPNRQGAFIQKKQYKTKILSKLDDGSEFIVIESRKHHVLLGCV